jgi:phosphoribosylformylglycinamidine cyclo-ligase
LIKGMAHITGGGIPDNLPRTLPEGVRYVLDESSWTVPPLFTWLQGGGGVETAEMFRAFNMGVGLIAACSPASADAALASLREAGEAPWVVGHVVAS